MGSYTSNAVNNDASESSQKPAVAATNYISTILVNNFLDTKVFMNDAADLEKMNRNLSTAEERVERHIRAANSEDGHGKNFENVNGGAIMLMSRDVPNRFSFYKADLTRPVADFGIRLSHIDRQYAQAGFDHDN